jgi:Xaa-Pro aminopeptidase
MTLRKDEFARRRRQLMRMMGKGAIAILPAATEKQRNSDVHYHYRPDSDFHYLTGFDEPEAVAVLVPGRPQAEYILFVRDRDPTRETWDGKRAERRATLARTTRSRSATSTTSCRDSSSSAGASTTRWASTRSSTST